MDTASLRQGFTAVPVMPVRPDVIAARNAVPTQLPVGQSVGSVGDAPAVRNEVSQQSAMLSRLAQFMQRPLEQRFERDRKTDVLVFKKIDPRYGDIVLQLPDQSLLNLRAYLKDQQDNLTRGTEKTA